MPSTPLLPGLLLLLLAFGLTAGSLSSPCSSFDCLLKASPGVSNAREKAVQWLLHRRAPDWGWEEDTARVIITLQLANISWLQLNDLEAQLSFKQLEIEILLGLWSRNHDHPLRAGRVAQFVNALESACKNPRAFHGHDLVSMLDHMETLHPFELGYVALASCNAGAHMKKKQERLLRSALAKSTKAENEEDTIAMLVQAIHCMSEQRRSRNFSNILHHPLKKLKQSQKKDGSFGNIHTSAIVTQALLSSSDEDGSWNATKALKFLLSQQQEDGSFGNQWATTAVLPILAGKSYVDISTTNCHEEESTSEHSSASPFDVGPPIAINYSLWIGNNVSSNHSILVNMPYNTSFFEIMKHAAELDDKYEFTAATTPNGHYVRSITGLAENTTASQYWLLGIFQEGQENGIKLVDVGVDEFYPHDGDHIVFWYKQI